MSERCLNLMDNRNRQWICQQGLLIGVTLLLLCLTWLASVYLRNDNGINTTTIIEYSHLAFNTESLAHSRLSTRVAMFGDTGVSNSSRAVYQMILDWSADFCLHAGDFDYLSSPPLFKQSITEILGEDYPFFAAIGNHDLTQWPRYRRDLIGRMNRANASQHCRGDYGVNMVCLFHGILFVLSGVGTAGRNHAQFIDRAMRANQNVPWKICVWHKNQRVYQLGVKRDETGYEVYDACRKHGALIVTGHEHSFSRTHLMRDFAGKSMLHDPANGERINDELEMKPGQSIAVVSGVGGREPRPWVEELRRNPWWAAVGAAQNGLRQGALFCEFHHSNNTADCQFRDYSGGVWDSFRMRSNPTTFATVS